jgi:low affinity Fe/Cu permease
LNEVVRRFARYTSELFGSSWAFCDACGQRADMGLTGPHFHYSDAWQLAINTGITILTFLMVFLIQNTQNRDSRATRLKLDELIKAVPRARSSMIELDRLTDEEVRELEANTEALRPRAGRIKDEPLIWPAVLGFGDRPVDDSKARSFSPSLVSELCRKRECAPPSRQ